MAKITQEVMVPHIKRLTEAIAAKHERAE